MIFFTFAISRWIRPVSNMNLRNQRGDHLVLGKPAVNHRRWSWWLGGAG